MQVCRICLCTDRKMYHLDSSSTHIYEQITGLPFVSEDLLPKLVCWECGYYMSKYFDFKSRAVTSYCILTEILTKNGVITNALLESANWNPYKSSLVQTNILCLVVKYDEEIEEDSTVSDTKIEPECDDTVVIESSNDEFDAELTDDTSALAPTNNNEEMEEDSTVSDTKIEPECDDTVVFETANDKFDAELTDDTSALAPTNEETEEERTEKKQSEESAKNETIKSNYYKTTTTTAQLPSVKRKRKAASEISKDKNNSIDKSKISNVTKWVGVRRKKVSTVKEKNDVKSSIDGLDKDLFHITELSMDDQIAALHNRKESINDKNDEFDAELTDDTSALAPTNTVEEREEERTEKKKSGESANNEIKIKKLPCNAKEKRERKKQRREREDSKHIKSVFEQIDKDFMVVTKLMTVDEQIAEIQMKKESDNYKNSPYKCESCFRGFVDIAAYERHIERHSESRGPHVCPVCKLRFSTLSTQKDHYAVAHSYKFSCLRCTFSTKYSYVAKQHQNYHKGKTYECPHCSVVFGYKTSYLSHLRIKHPSEIVCKHCGYTFLNELGLKKHIRWNHRDDQKQVPLDGPECARCDIRFSCQDALDTHRRVSAQHADERNAGIVKPGRNTRQRQLTRNTRQRKITKRYYNGSLDGPISCEQCGEHMQSPMAYKVHFNKAHKGKTRTRYFPHKPGMCMCDVCGKFFQSEFQLRRHQYAHSSSKQFKCDRCGRRFQLEVYLYNHRRSHCGTRIDYPCGVCGQKFSTDGNRRRHMGKHTGVQFKCQFCDKVFHCQGNMKVHVDFVHMKKPAPKRNRNRGPRSQADQSKVKQRPTYGTESDAALQVHEESSSSSSSFQPEDC